MLLDVRDLHAYYGKSHILHGISFGIAEAEIVTLLGRNGSGRSTTLKAILGMVPPSSGEVSIGGRQVAGRRPSEVARAGIAYVPEERLIFHNITVEENLRLGMKAARDGAATWSIPEMYDYFPRLAERRNTQAGKLSGGEQQMLTICRSLLGNPRVILIDEPTEGLAPKLVEGVMNMILEIHKRGVSVLLVEQKLTIALKVASRVLVMGHGQIVFTGTPAELAADPQIRRTWLEVN